MWCWGGAQVVLKRCPGVAQMVPRRCSRVPRWCSGGGARVVPRWCPFVRVQVCMYACTHVCIHVCVCMYVCMYVCRHVTRHFLVQEAWVTEAVRVRRAVAGLARNGQFRIHMLILSRSQIILEREWAIITIVVILTGTSRFGATPWMRARDGNIVIHNRRAPTNTGLVALSGRSFTARVDTARVWGPPLPLHIRLHIRLSLVSLLYTRNPTM